MGNANTEHSKQLREKTSAEWKKENITSRAYMMNKNNPEDVENLELFEEMKGSTIDKFREIFRVYKLYLKSK